MGWLVLAGLAGLPVGVSASSISVYIAQPGLTTSPVTGGTATTESFNTISTGTKTSNFATQVGTVAVSPSSPLLIQNADQYGGAANTGRRRFAAFGAQTGTAGAVGLNLTQSTTVFGMWWSAMDNNNGVSLYSGNTLLTRYSSSDLVNIFNANSQLTAINNVTTYNTADYFGNPTTNPRSNTGEYYAFVMFEAKGVSFDRLVFDNSNTTATGFEMDNWTLNRGSYTIPGTNVLVREIQVVPEPDFWVPVIAGLGGAAWWRRRKRKAGSEAGGAEPEQAE